MSPIDARTTTGRPTVWLTGRRFWRDEKARNHFFYPMAAADHAEGGQAEPVLGVIL